MTDGADLPSNADDAQRVPPLTLEQLYTSTPEGAQLERDLHRSLHPRSWDLLLAMLGSVRFQYAGSGGCVCWGILIL